MGKGYSLITLTIKRGEFLMKPRIINMKLNKTQFRQNIYVSLGDKHILLMGEILPSSAREHTNHSRRTANAD